MNSGDFFQPLSAVMALGIVGALVSGWRTPLQLRFWLWLGFIMFLIIWAITPTVFWPMIHELYGSAIGRISRTDAELVQPRIAGLSGIGFAWFSLLSALLRRCARSLCPWRPMGQF
jgi:hypothetical protein